MDEEHLNLSVAARARWPRSARQQGFRLTRPWLLRSDRSTYPASFRSFFFLMRLFIPIFILLLLAHYELHFHVRMTGPFQTTKIPQETFRLVDVTGRTGWGKQHLSAA